MRLDQRLLVRPERIDGTERLALSGAEQHRRALAFIIAEIGAMLAIADRRCKLGRKVARDVRRIDASTACRAQRRDQPARLVEAQHPRGQTGGSGNLADVVSVFHGRRCSG
jgi:hypothetical protein